MKLYAGRKFTGIEVKRDQKYPIMWRVHFKGEVSDMVNLTRAKDAAISWAFAELGKGARGFNWKVMETRGDHA